MSWQKEWANEREGIITTERPVIEMKYGEHHIKIWSRGVMTGAPAEMRLTRNLIPIEKHEAYLT